MHCPRCGQQQISEETKFCSRCGFPLGLVSEIVAHGGFLPQLANVSNKKKWLTRNNGVKLGLAWFLVFTFLITPLAAIADLDEGAAAIAVIGFMGGLLMMLFSWLFLEKEPKPVYTHDMNAAPNYLYGNQAAQNALPPQQTYPAQGYASPPANSWKAPDTGDLHPGSVTEGTTKLLNRDE